MIWEGKKEGIEGSKKGGGGEEWRKERIRSYPSRSIRLPPFFSRGQGSPQADPKNVNEGIRIPGERKKRDLVFKFLLVLQTELVTRFLRSFIKGV